VEPDSTARRDRSGAPGTPNEMGVKIVEGRSEQRSPKPAVQLEILPGIGAVVTLRGEHDISTEPMLGEVLSRACGHGHALVDFGECRYLDSTVVKLLLAAHGTQTAAGRRLELVIPPEATAVDRLARLIHLAEIMPIHPSRAAGVAALTTGA
jgi:anti-anti-sigma factor